MENRLHPDICVIGAGAGGLVVAAGAAMLGAKVILVERGAMGGDCLNYGCVPSKALLAAGEAAHAGREAAAPGVRFGSPAIDFTAVMLRVRETVDSIAPMDAEARFLAMGVEVIKGNAVFRNERELDVAGRIVAARRFVVATGSAPVVPPIAGIESVPHLTNETVFGNTELPQHLIVIGGGPVGLELAQAHRRLGATVTVVEAASCLGREDPEVAALINRRLRKEGVTLLERTTVASVTGGQSGVSICIERNGAAETLLGSHLLVASGRRPQTDVGLDRAGVDYDNVGIKVDSRLRTTNRRIFAIGDVTGAPQFTHVASYHAGIALRNILFRIPARVSYRSVPRVTYTDPELAQVGLSEAEARRQFGRVSVARWPVADNDRARTQGDVDGLIKVVATLRGRILGAQIVARHAGELIVPWIRAVARRERLSTWAGLVTPYPIYGEIGKRAAGSFFLPAMSRPGVRALVRILGRLG